MDGKSMFGDIKSKLGFGRKNDYEEFYEDYEEFEEGDDYGEYGYDESYERTSGSAYDPYDSVTTREPGERSRSRSSMPRLVSIDDVRARTAVLTPSRTLKVVAPGAYNDAEAVSTALKLGNAVVLNLAATPDALAKRILDFSFGVASALDANVECVGNKVFALTRIDELTEAERSYLRTQGII